VAKTLGQSVSFPTGYSQAIVAGEIQVRPTFRDYIVASVKSLPAQVGQGVVVIHNGQVVQAPPTSGPAAPFVSSLAFDSTATVYTFNGEDTGFDLVQNAIGPTGLTPGADSPGLVNGFFNAIHSGGGVLVSDGGVVLNAGVLVARLPVTNGHGAFLDVASQRIFILEFGGGVGATDVTIQAFDSLTYNLLGTTTIHNLQMDSPDSLREASLCRFGSKGLAFKGSSALYFLDNAPGL
jgi:hypothetical protein